MSSCCSDYACGSSSHFGHKRAAADLARYRRKGLDLTTRLLTEEIRPQLGDISSILDVGGGIGALTFAILDRSQATAVLVEASSAFLEAASQESERRQVAGRVAFAAGDFVDLAPDLSTADLVTMDRVVCCYRAFGPLLEAGLAHATRYFAFSYPRDRWYVRATTALENLRRTIRPNPFLTYVHPVTDMHAIVSRHGFVLLRSRRTLTWAVEVWRRAGKPGSKGGD